MMPAQDSNTDAEVDKIIHRRMTLNSLETASSWFNISVVVLTLLLAIAGFFAWYFSTKLGTMKDEALTRFKTEAGREIASAGARAAEANKTAAEAGAQVAAANERTKILELEVPKQRERAAKAEKALLELQEKLKDRHLTAPQRVDLIKFLNRSSDGAIEVICAGGQNPEPCLFASEIVEILKSTGWTVSFSNGNLFLGGVPPVGLTIQIDGQAPPRATALWQAFENIGLAASITGKEGRVSDKILLIVGSKP